MPGNNDGKSKEHEATVSLTRFAALEASVADLAALLRDSLACDPQWPSGPTLSSRAAIAAFGAINQHRRDFLAYLRLKAAGDAGAGRDKTLTQITPPHRRRAHTPAPPPTPPPHTPPDDPKNPKQPKPGKPKLGKLDE
eukprot:jgi/Tetstr1/446815/TSEL_034295.t1